MTPHPTAVSRRTFVQSSGALAMTPVIPALQKKQPTGPSNPLAKPTFKSDPPDLLFSSATEMLEQMNRRKVSAEELVKMHLRQIESTHSKINAFIQPSSDAIEVARQRDQERRTGHLRGPLHGLPMTLKDCWDTAGVISTWSTPGRKHHIPGQDATIARRLKQAGAILLGKTNTPEFTLSFDTQSPLHGATKNPHDLKRTPGGSSGGAGALIASGGTPFDIGTDYGGSVRVPCHFCGIAGIKPTSGSVPRTGMCLPPGGLRDFQSHVGPMARYTQDLELVLAVIWGPDRFDTWIADVPLRRSLDLSLKGMKCLVMEQFGSTEPTSHTLKTIRSAAKALQETGVELVPDELPLGDEIAALEMDLWENCGTAYEIAYHVQKAGTSLDEFSIHFVRDMIRSSNTDFSPDRFHTTVRKLQNVRSQCLQKIADYDLMLSPVNAGPAPVQPGAHEPLFPLHHANYTLVSDLTGWPSGVVRCGTSSGELPIGVQITANPWREDIVLATLTHLEAALGGFQEPSL